MDLKKINKKLMLFGLIGLGIVVVIIVVISLTSNKTLSYSKIEERMEKAARKYYVENSDQLPQEDHGKVTIGINELEGNYLRPMIKMVKKGVICNGEVRVIKNEGHYLYIPYLNCGEEYATNELYKVIIDKNNIVTSGDGIYKMNKEYVYRGENVNNYAKFAGKLWRIVKVSESNNIKIIEEESRDAVPWDNRYNHEKGYNTGFNNFKVSRIYDTLQEIYNSNEFSSVNKSSIVSQKLCIGKRTEKDTKNDNSIECSQKTELEPLGMLQVNEYINASIDKNCKKIDDSSCQNYNYLHSYNRIWWTITGKKGSSYEVYRINNARVNTTSASSYAIPRLVVTISDNVIYKSGDGTIENPYIIN